LRPKLRELALAVADIAKAISLTLVSKEWGGATLSADKKVIRHHFRAEKSEKCEIRIMELSYVYLCKTR